MTSRLQEIARHKQALIDKAQLQRIELVAACKRIRSPLEMSGSFFRVARALSAHPLATAGLSSFVLGGLGKSLFRSARMVFGLRTFLPPLWAWWITRRKGR